MLVDTHCHINDPEAFPDIVATLEEAREAGVERIIVVGVEPESCRRAIELAETFGGVFAIVGWHPNYTANYRPEALGELKDWLAHPKVLALGEIGLDFHWTYASLEQQQRALYDQLDLATELGLPVVFHCREAYDRLLTILESRPLRPYLFHCFAGDDADADRAKALDCYFGIDGPITYKKSSALREIVRTLPQNRIVVETDSPYLTPEPFRGKPNRPALVKVVSDALASVLGMTPEACAAMTTANAERFFRLP